MASFIYPSAVQGLLLGTINFSRDRFGVILLDSSHEPNAADTDLSDLDGEISGPGYIAGGRDVDAAIIEDRGQTSVILGGASWADSSLGARYAAYFAQPGPLVALIDFGKEVQSLNDVFSLTESEIKLYTGTK